MNESGGTDFNPQKWGASVRGQTENSLTLTVFTPASAPVGEWGVTVRTIVDAPGGVEESLTWQYKHDDEFSLIFNPWCKGE